MFVRITALRDGVTPHPLRSQVLTFTANLILLVGIMIGGAAVSHHLFFDHSRWEAANQTDAGE